MKLKLLCGCALFAFAIASLPVRAQTKTSWTFSCPAADDLQTVTAAAHGGLAFVIGQGKCSVTGDVGGSASKSITDSSYAEASGNQLRAWGVFMDTLASGEEVGYIYQMTATPVNGVIRTAQMTYQLNSGTGSLQGISGSGTCQVTSNTSGGSDGSCTGQYTLFQPPPATQ